MKTNQENLIIQFLRVAFSIPIGIFALSYFQIKSGAVRIVYFFGVYILISIIIEIIRKLLNDKSEAKANRH
jgi:uncharacterized membrane protein HdeD (DUF308 family)